MRNLEGLEATLIAAQAESERQIASEERASRAAARKATRQRVRELDRAMEKHLTALLKGIDALGAHTAVFKRARQEIVTIARKHRDAFASPRELGELSYSLFNEMARERGTIEGRLCAAGFSEFGVGNRQAWMNTKNFSPSDALVFKRRAIGELLAVLSDKEG